MFTRVSKRVCSIILMLYINHVFICIALFLPKIHKKKSSSPCQRRKTCYWYHSACSHREPSSSRSYHAPALPWSREESGQAYSGFGWRLLEPVSTLPLPPRATGGSLKAARSLLFLLHRLCDIDCIIVAGLRLSTGNSIVPAQVPGHRIDADHVFAVDQLIGKRASAERYSRESCLDRPGWGTPLKASWMKPIVTGRIAPF